ncbi:hypothetical protein [Nocardia sp. AG03]|uniref:hypothetical protein n=1 Tax=Nocardia sp. AG03 TaxID=3025312 RepID=UPI002418217A|nr:hypothetical protein [Nocardia sp. AG03]
MPEPEVPAATVAYTHLFPGLTIELPADSFDVEFIDGRTARATVQADARGEDVLVVESYRTEAGTNIPETVWPVSPADRSAAAKRVTLGKPLRVAGE